MYVDDIIIAGRDKSSIKRVKRQLAAKFDIKDLGKLSYFLGISIIQDQDKKTTWMGQTAYTERLLAKMGMNDCNQVKTPADPGNHLVKADEDEPALNQQLYRSAVGSLMYLATSTRPDISFAVGTLARFSSKPNKSHWIALKRVLRYLKGTVGYGITFRGDGSGEECMCFSDADWAGNKDDRRSTSGYLSRLQVDQCLGAAKGRILWLSRQQKQNIWRYQVLLRK